MVLLAWAKSIWVLPSLSMFQSWLLSLRLTFAHHKSWNKQSTRLRGSSNLQEQEKSQSLSRTAKSVLILRLNLFLSVSALSSRSQMWLGKTWNLLESSWIFFHTMDITMQKLLSNSISTTPSLSLSLVLLFQVSSKVVLCIRAILSSSAQTLLGNSQPQGVSIFYNIAEALLTFIDSIRSIERKRISVPAASAGQSASFALKRVRRKDVRKGMVVLPKLDQSAPKVYREFVAEGKYWSILYWFVSS